MLQNQIKMTSLILKTCYLNGSIIANAPFISASLVLALAFVIIFLLSRRRPRRLSNIFIAGLDDGKRTLEQARKHFVLHCADMLIEGYEKVFPEKIE